MTEFQSTEKLRRLQLLAQFAELRSPSRTGGSMSGNKAARILGESHAVLSRWQRRLEEGGEDALAPEQATACGRKPKFELNQDEQNALRHCRLRKNSLPLAIEDFMNEPECRPDTREKIAAEMDAAAREERLPRWPMSIQRAGYVSDDIKAHFRGKKHAQEFEIIERRGLWFIDEDSGREVPITGNTLFESDDMSSNEPFRYRDPETGIVRVGRQMLATQNVYSAAFLGVSPVGRERDAYRLEDMADHVRETVLAHGLPLIWRFERGPWENSVIDGIKLGDGTHWGGLSALFQVRHVFKSRSKGLIETSFDLLQSLTAHESMSIGRSRGEFERATKLFLAAGRGDASAASHFWEIAEAADEIANAMVRFNERPKIRRAFGKQAVVPADLQSAAPKRECQASELWRFSPVKRMATVRGGAVEVSVDHYPFPFRFRVNGASDVYLERGYSVLIAFHPGRPEEGCHIFNAETGSRNRHGVKFGEFLFVAPFAEDAPQLNLRPDEYEFVARKNANAAVRSEFRAIVGAGVRGRRVSTAQDGYGSSKRIETSPPTRSGARGDPASSLEIDHESAAAAIHLRSQRRPSDFDEEAELNRIARLESEAIERGDLVT
jgi:hypothetical protein